MILVLEFHKLIENALAVNSGWYKNEEQNHCTFRVIKK
jgi:hypothetical protein